MNVTVDGIIYQSQFYGGISHLWDEILPRMCDEDKSLYINLLTSGECKKAPPVHTRINHHVLFPVDGLLRPTRFWGSTRFHIRAYLQYLSRIDSIDGIWHSTFFTLPHRWKGPVVLTVYDMVTEQFAVELFNNSINKDYREYKRRCVDAADIIICISQATKCELENYFQVDPTKIKVIHLAASREFKQIKTLDNIDGLRVAKPFFMYVGGRHSYKNFKFLLKAYSSWKRKEAFDLVVVGSRWTQQEIELIESLKLREQVILHDDIDNDKLCDLYNKASAFVFPSLSEGFGIPLLEAMACSCPIVASRIPSTLEVAKDCPVYFEPREMDSIVSAFDHIVTEGRDSERVGLGLKRVNEFSWDITSYETLRVYRDLMGGKRK